MGKPKIAISVDQSLLDLVDSKVDGNIIRSRSQAIEFYLRKGLQSDSIHTAVILLRGIHQKIALTKVKGTSLIQKQLSFFEKNNVNNVLIVTQRSPDTKDLLNEIAHTSVNVEVIEQEGRGNASVLASIRDKVKSDLIVMSGDTFNDFDLLKMIKKHLDIDKLATMGLMTRSETKEYGIAILDGDYIIDFQEKPKESATNIVNAGVYIFKKEIFELFEGASLEKDVFPKLARMKQLVGFFTYGEYEHFG